MAKDLKRALWVHGWTLLLLSVIPAISRAQALIDPTMPPAELSARTGEAIPETNILQSIIISGNRRAAILYGQTVEQGGKVGDVRLIEVNERGVVLQGAKGRQVLTLFPNVKIDKKTDLSVMENEVTSPVRKGKFDANSNRRIGTKEEQ